MFLKIKDEKEFENNICLWKSLLDSKDAIGNLTYSKENKKGLSILLLGALDYNKVKAQLTTLPEGTV